MKFLTGKTIKIKSCPICGFTNNVFHSLSKKNLYSEKISKILNVNENKMLSKIYNVKCKKCSLIYKNFWFKPNIIKILFKKEIPLHPKGVDIFEKKKFKKKYFLKEFNNLIKFHKNNKEKINKSKRVIGSIISAIDSSSKTLESCKKTLNKDNEDYKKKKFQKNILKISKLIKKPKRFSRFVGYNDRILWNYLMKITDFKIYGEVGCPSWGMLKIAKRSKKKIFFYDRKENNFWNEKILIKKSRLKKKEIVYSLDYKKNSLFGIIEYLDHLVRPLNFLNEVAYSNDSFFILTEDPTKNNLPIQHFTGFQNTTFFYIAKKINKLLILNNRILKSKNMILAIFKKN